MSMNELSMMAPLLLLLGAIVVAILAIIVKRNHEATALIVFVGTGLALVSLFGNHGSPAQRVTELLIFDSYSRFFMGLIFLATLATIVLSFGYLRSLRDRREEFYVLLLSATLGTAVMVASSHLVSFFLGLEVLSVPLYAMIAYCRQADRSLEAGVKYLILAATSSAFLLLGIAFIYADLGTMQFGTIAVRLGSQASSPSLILLSGLVFTTVGIGFKLGVVPFHMWTPDVYDGAPAPVTAYIATISKGAMVALLLRFFTSIHLSNMPSLLGMFTMISILSMFIGNFLALMQSNVKRILAYSSIAHLGYILVAFLASGAMAAEAISYYLVAYFVTTLAAFGVVTILSTSDHERVSLDDYRGLLWTRPWIGAVFTAALLSLAGIPLTAGFIGKYLVITAGIGAAQWTLVIILVINSAIGLFYYLRVMVAMFSHPLPAVDPGKRMSFGSGVVLGVLMTGMLFLGVYPTPLVELIRSTISGFLT
jgi:NADH-quinone oxidoreductase subunit N